MITVIIVVCFEMSRLGCRFRRPFFKDIKKGEFFWSG